MAAVPLIQMGQAVTEGRAAAVLGREAGGLARAEQAAGQQLILVRMLLMRMKLLAATEEPTQAAVAVAVDTTRIKSRIQVAQVALVLSSLELLPQHLPLRGLRPQALTAPTTYTPSQDQGALPSDVLPNSISRVRCVEPA